MMLAGYLCSGKGHWAGQADVAARMMHSTKRGLRRALAGLQDAGLLGWSEHGTTLRIKLVGARERFIWAPEFEDERLLMCSARALRSLIVFCAHADNRGHHARLRLSTLAEKMGRCKRTVQLGVAELVDRAICVVFRTGRANIVSIERGRWKERRDPKVAPRAGAALRLLSSISDRELWAILARIRSRLSTMCEDHRKPVLEGFLRDAGFTADEAGTLIRAHSYAELIGALTHGCGGRRRTEAALGAGWFAW